MELNKIEIIGVVGAGTMGNGIAHVFAQHRFQVKLYDVAQTALEKALKTIDRNLERQIKKGVISADEKSQILGRIRPTTVIEDLREVQFCVEAAPENEELKKSLFRQLDELLAPEVILASNTSSISITTLGAQTNRSAKVIGMHFMNPVPVMKLVEVVQGQDTDKETVEITMELARKAGKEPVAVKDFPGFISNRVLMPMINEAIYALMEGVADKEAIDKIMQLGMAHPMGPLTLADFIGLDVCLAILEVLYEGFGDPKYRPCPLLKRMVAAGHLGRKTGRGFYSY
jgi:3-hydroxyacyl-CoA dehydrogenase